jgi:hypothetical protein
MDQTYLIMKLEAIERKIKLGYYIDAERIVEDMLYQLGRVRELSEDEREFLIADAKLGDPKP